jgi:tetratricopeptide (TPR) repeat protein
MLCVLAIAGCALAARVAHADARGSTTLRADAPIHVTAPFWRSVKNPDLKRAETLTRQGRAHLYPALGLSMLLGADVTTHRRASLENAIARFERAHQLAPEDPEITYLSARALALWERRRPTGLVERRTQEAIERFQALRAQDPAYRAYDVAFQLGILYTHLGEVGRAALEYERALAVRVDEGSRSMTLANLAEVTMMAQMLDRSVALYEQAAEEGEGAERVLALLGLAVALDRLGEHSEAIANARTAIREDQRPLGALRQSDVFFVPPYEEHYYEGIGLMALAEEQAGSRGALLGAARRFDGLIARDVSLGLLLSFKQILSGLAEEGLDREISTLQAAVDQAVERARTKGRSRVPEDAALDSPEARAVLSLLQSLRSFARYANAGGDTGPWSEDARAHTQEILRWLVGDKSTR